jgi:hypothetical protein
MMLWRVAFVFFRSGLPMGIDRVYVDSLFALPLLALVLALIPQTRKFGLGLLLAAALIWLWMVAEFIFLILFLGIPFLIFAAVLTAWLLRGFLLKKSAKHRWVAPLAGLGLGVVSNLMLNDIWSGPLGPWMDCPNYAFGTYTILPLPFVFDPLVLASCGLGVFTCLLAFSWRNKQRWPMAAYAFGLLVNVVPFVVTIVLPLLSNWLGQTTPGC